MEGGLTTPTSSHRNWTSKGGHVTSNWRVSYPAFMVAMLVIGFASYVFLSRLDQKRTASRRTRPH